MISFLAANWPAPSNIKAGVTLRSEGVSAAPFAHGNLALHVDDNPEHVLNNRQSLADKLGFSTEQFQWLEQVHGNHVVEAKADQKVRVADACYSGESDVVCGVLTADCLPVLLCDTSGNNIAAIHAGWRSLAAGIIERTVKAMQSSQPLTPTLMAWLGPAIAADAFEVGDDVRQAFLSHDHRADKAFSPYKSGQANKYHCDLYQLARQRLAQVGVDDIYGGDFCTYSDAGQWYSYRRDGATGRMLSFIAKS